MATRKILVRVLACLGTTDACRKKKKDVKGYFFELYSAQLFLRSTVSSLLFARTLFSLIFANLIAREFKFSQNIYM